MLGPDEALLQRAVHRRVQRPEQLRQVRQSLPGGRGLRRGQLSGAVRPVPRAREQRLCAERYRRSPVLRVAGHRALLRVGRAVRRCRVLLGWNRSLRERERERPVLLWQSGLPGGSVLQPESVSSVRRLRLLLVAKRLSGATMSANQTRRFMTALTTGRHAGARATRLESSVLPEKRLRVARTPGGARDVPPPTGNGDRPDDARACWRAQPAGRGSSSSGSYPSTPRRPTPPDDRRGPRTTHQCPTGGAQ